MLKRWKEENEGAHSPAELGVPPALLQAVKGVYDDLQADFRRTLEQAKLVHEAQELRTAEELQQSRAKNAAMEECASALRATLDDANKVIVKLQDANQLLTVAMAGAQSDQAGLQQRLADRAAEVAALNVQLTQSRSQFEHYQESTAAQRSEERQAFDQRAARMDLDWHHANNASYITMPCRSISWSSGNVLDSSSDKAYSPGDCGDKSNRDVSAPRTMIANCCRAGSSSAYLARNASKLHS